MVVILSVIKMLMFNSQLHVLFRFVKLVTLLAISAIDWPDDDVRFRVCVWKTWVSFICSFLAKIVFNT